ncbi:MAG: hypothetical protein P8X49_04085, partial [Syntrophobacterales bacterium]
SFCLGGRCPEGRRLMAAWGNFTTRLQKLDVIPGPKYRALAKPRSYHFRVENCRDELHIETGCLGLDKS